MDAPRGKNVLLVDDDARTARRLAQMLREDGFDVDVACDGAAAVARLSREPPPDVLVTDLVLPHTDGTALARFARWRRPDLPVVFITGHPELLPDGIDPTPMVLVKPIEYAELAAKLLRG